MKRLSDDDLAFEDHPAVANHADGGGARNDAVEDVAAGDGPHLRHAIDLANLGAAVRDLLERRLEQPDHRVPEVVEQLVDHGVEADLDLLLLGELDGVPLRSDVEADDDRLGGRREQHVVGGDRADAAVQHRRLHLGRADLLDRVAQHFERALHVGLEHHGEILDLALFDLAEELLQREPGAGRDEVLLARLLLAELDDAARLLFVADDLEGIAGLRDVGESGDFSGGRRTGLECTLAAIVAHRAHASPGRSRDEDVAHLERAVLDEDGRDDAAAGLLACLEHDPWPAVPDWP